MPRRKRVYGESGYYHVIIKGTNKNEIFVDDADNLKFISILKRYKEEIGFGVDAYCLMKTHAHLLVKTSDEKLQTIMKKIAVSYVYYYNRKYDTEGHLFRDRYKSEPVDSDEYYLAVLKYILRNPEKAGVCPHSLYRWSSYTDYVNGTGITDTEFALSLLQTKEKFVEFMTLPSAEEMFKIDAEQPNKNDADAEKIISDILGNTDLTQLMKANPEAVKKMLVKITNRGVSVRQISRITGINRNILRKYSPTGTVLVGER